ncbi:Dabb family protein [Microbacterium schleiferi]|uniref:Dabb family protein n=1 Tax=Microbacterium schleiferi TaxID=69362 RepID=A0ABU7V2Y7_9MICO
MFRHIVLFRVHDEASNTDVESALESLRALGSQIDAQSWRVQSSLDTRKGRVLIEDATFRDATEFERFRTHPAHRQVAEAMAQISDWWVGDYDAPDN